MKGDEQVMALKVAFPFRHHGTLFCDEARQMLVEAGFELICNDTGCRLSREAQKEMICDAFAVVAGTEIYDEEMLNGCDQLKTVMRFGVGTDNFDLNAMRRRGIQVGIIANHCAVAEFALTLILAAMKNVTLYDAAVRRGGWNRYGMRELSRKTVGLIGFGRIAKQLTRLLSGFDVAVLASDPYADPEDAKERGVELVLLDELLARSDVISLHLPANQDTYHLINRSTIAKMKKGAYLINTARGALVDETALYEALDSGKLAGAGIDVFEKEPVTADNRLFGVTNCVLAPHVSALSYETNYNGSLICAESIIRVKDGGRPVYPL